MRGSSNIINLVSDSDDAYGDIVALEQEYSSDGDDLMNLSGIGNLSDLAGYRHSPSPSMRPVDVAVPVAPVRSSAPSPNARVIVDLASSAPAPKKKPSSEAVAIAAAPEPAAKKKIVSKKNGNKPEKKRSADERLGDLRACCHKEAMNVAFVDGMETGGFSKRNVLHNQEEEACGCLVFTSQSSGVVAPHVLRVMSVSEMLEMLREEERQQGRERVWVTTMELMDSFAETMKDCHKDRHLTVMLYGTDKEIEVKDRSRVVCTFLLFLLEICRVLCAVECLAASKKLCCCWKRRAFVCKPVLRVM
jgi:hypothetical protein